MPAVQNHSGSAAHHELADLVIGGILLANQCTLAPSLRSHRVQLNRCCRHANQPAASLTAAVPPVNRRAIITGAFTPIADPHRTRSPQWRNRASFAPDATVPAGTQAAVNPPFHHDMAIEDCRLAQPLPTSAITSGQTVALSVRLKAPATAATCRGSQGAKVSTATDTTSEWTD